ncbi:hypothetical protein EXIGLDRAFT_761236 [Exidia glandulosa HHB12029]|uniref:HTH CENPB-type domain-containing protein n=1 Tax=Exidia glandulosa HHB12029 TaxID=1314781 RepID=A0A165NMC1_EXIGL|nr:hypothetical protein EXIGLDRAFT_761236 [Exidia glandulosa HHB12029]
MDNGHAFMYQDPLSSAGQWSTEPAVHDAAGLYYSQQELDNAQQYVMHQHQQQSMEMALAPPSTPSDMAAGILTRSQRARVAAQQSTQSQPVTPDVARRSPVYTGHYPQMNLFTDQSAFLEPIQSPSDRPALSLAAAAHFHPPAHAHGSPQYPSTPTTVSSAPSSRAYYSAGGRSASPAVSVASTRTSVSSVRHASMHSHDPMAMGDCSMDVAPDASQHPFQPEGAAAAAFDLSNAAAGVEPLGGRVPRTRKTRLYNIDRKAICCYAKAHPEARQEDIAARYGVERSTISKILKQKQKWMSVPEGEELKIIKHRPSKFPALEKRLLIQLKQCARETPPVTLTDQLIRNKARDVAKEIGISEDKFKASSGWVENFKHRHNIRRGVLIGRRRHRNVGADGELTGEDESDYEYAIFDGEEGLTKEERMARRAEQKKERLELFRIAEEQIMEEHHDQIAQGLLDEELRMELVMGRRSQLLRLKQAGKPLDQLPGPVEATIAIDLHHVALEEHYRRLEEGPDSMPRSYALIGYTPPSAPGPSGVTSYNQAAASASSHNETNVDAAVDSLNYVAHNIPPEFMTREEKAVLEKLTGRLKTRSSARRA